MENCSLKLTVFDLDNTAYYSEVIHKRNADRKFDAITKVIADRNDYLEEAHLSKGIIRVWDISDAYTILKDAYMDQYSYPDRLVLNITVNA